MCGKHRVARAPAPSLAAKVVIKDGKSDTWSDTWDDEAEAWAYTEAGSMPNTDVVRTTLTHTATEVRITVTYADLVVDGPSPTNRSWLRLSTGDRAVLTVWTTDKGKTELFLWRPDAAHPRAACRGVPGAFDFDADSLTVGVPRSCLGDPAWVRLHGSSLTEDPSDPGGEALFQDQANGDGYDRDGLLAGDDCFSGCRGWTGKVRHG